MFNRGSSRKDVAAAAERRRQRRESVAAVAAAVAAQHTAVNASDVADHRSPNFRRRNFTNNHANLLPPQYTVLERRMSHRKWRESKQQLM